MSAQIAVVGAGVVGCSVAVNLQEKFGDKVNVTVISECFSPNTTSDKAGAIILPFDVRSEGKIDAVNSENIKRWTRETFRYYDSLYFSEETGDVDLQLVHGYYSEENFREGERDPWWAELTPGFRHVQSEEKIKMRIPSKFQVVYSFNTYIINGRNFVPWLMKKIERNGGHFVQKKVKDISELSSYDIVVNCTGMGSVELVGDTSIYPVRGDAVIIKAPWIKQFYFLIGKENYTYIFPRSSNILLGGTGEKNNWSDVPKKEASDAILKRCSDVVPSISCAQILDTWAGLRPVREIIRLEKEEETSGKPVVIHCYGHGGQGLTLAWGCANDVVKIVVDCLKEKTFLQQKL